ncbi:hypothetical protein [Halobacillus sp. Marseille-Q1614]|uniref:hypothetical protein n=1 Tax=Halobacillus sp. Marseille-Q1614 TaxID=2709134 RepID=UPI00156DF9E7|nr:hypothetical protein [Halobacillus sp. Marseille-Q1614]
MVRNENRIGLRIRSDKEVNSAVRESCINFAKWLRTTQEFPIRVVVYLKKDSILKTIEIEEFASATFFAPSNKTHEPYIRIATGDYEQLVSDRGEIDALWAILKSMAHELVHYHQWINDKYFDEDEAERLSEYLLDEFAETL